MDRQVILRGCCSKSNHGPYVVFVQRREVLQDIGDAVPLRKAGENRSNGDARSRNYRFTATDFRITNNAVLEFHCLQALERITQSSSLDQEVHLQCSLGNFLLP